MTLFNYNELCLNLDLHYGLKDTHKIKDFDSYLNRMGLKEEYLSGNVFRIEKANKKLSTVCFSDFHSAFRNSSPYLDSEKYDINEDPTENNKVYVDRAQKLMLTTIIRGSFLGEVAPYERRGDTVFITFDSFSVKESKKDYYNKNKDEETNLKDEETNPEEESNPEEETNIIDTIELFSASLERLKNEDSDLLILGQQSGGGACAVGYAATAAGSLMQISSTNQLVSTKNRSIQDIDNGITPDIYLSYKRMYDRDYIANLVSEQFGN